MQTLFPGQVIIHSFLGPMDIQCCYTFCISQTVLPFLSSQGRAWLPMNSPGRAQWEWPQWVWAKPFFYTCILKLSSSDRTENATLIFCLCGWFFLFFSHKVLNDNINSRKSWIWRARKDWENCCLPSFPCLQIGETNFLQWMPASDFFSRNPLTEWNMQNQTVFCTGNKWIIAAFIAHSVY